MIEVEAQVSWRYNRSRLLHVRAENFTKGSVHQVRRSVITTRRIALLDVHLSRNTFANVDTSLFNFDLVHDQTLGRRIGVVDNCQRAALTNQHSHIADLSTTLGIERRPIEDNLAFFALVQ